MKTKLGNVEDTRDNPVAIWQKLVAKIFEQVQNSSKQKSKLSNSHKEIKEPCKGFKSFWRGLQPIDILAEVNSIIKK